jgi:hypothetical protein
MRITIGCESSRFGYVDWRERMAYVNPNYKTKKEFIAAVKVGVQHRPYNSGEIFPVAQNGPIAIEGPHYPKPHTWYSSCIVKDGIIVSAK